MTTQQVSPKLGETIDRIKSEEMSAILKIQSSALKAVYDCMHEKEVLQLMPVVISPNH